MTVVFSCCTITAFLQYLYYTHLNKKKEAAAEAANNSQENAGDGTNEPLKKEMSQSELFSLAMKSHNNEFNMSKSVLSSLQIIHATPHILSYDFVLKADTKQEIINSFVKSHNKEHKQQYCQRCSNNKHSHGKNSANNITQPRISQTMPSKSMPAIQMQSMQQTQGRVGMIQLNSKETMNASNHKNNQGLFAFPEINPNAGLL